MYSGLMLFRTASAKASYSAAGQGLVARNIANADTPGYTARRLVPFEDSIFASKPKSALRALRSSHLPSIGNESKQFAFQTTPTDATPNGNAVSLETEMMRAASIKQDHDLAVAAYRGGMTLLRTALGRSS